MGQYGIVDSGALTEDRSQSLASGALPRARLEERWQCIALSRSPGEIYFGKNVKTAIGGAGRG